MFNEKLKVYLISKPSLNIAAINQFLQDNLIDWNQTPDTMEADNLVEFSGRICYMSFGSKQSRRTNAEYISNLIEKSHESVLEHASWTFVVSGVTRAFSHQLVRHRAGFSFSQLSQQYHDESEADFLIPHGLESNDKLLPEWLEEMDALRNLYSKMAKKASNSNVTDANEKEQLRKTRSIARSLLPNCTETKLVMTANARALRHLLQVRGSIIGDLEMRNFCNKLLTLLMQESPALFDDIISTYCEEDGYPIISAT